MFLISNSKYFHPSCISFLNLTLFHQPRHFFFFFLFKDFLQSSFPCLPLFSSLSSLLSPSILPSLYIFPPISSIYYSISFQFQQTKYPIVSTIQIDYVRENIFFYSKKLSVFVSDKNLEFFTCQSMEARKKVEKKKKRIIRNSLRVCLLISQISKGVN